MQIFTSAYLCMLHMWCICMFMYIYVHIRATKFNPNEAICEPLVQLPLVQQFVSQFVSNL